MTSTFSDKTYLDYPTLRNVNRDNLRKWVAALRSGNFVQGNGALSGRAVEDGTQKFCCLGVACEVAIENGLELHRVTDLDSFSGTYIFKTSYDDELAFLPKRVRQWLGMPEYDNPIIAVMLENPGEKYQWEESVTATEANDSMNWSFAEIADAVERFYKLTGDH